MRSTLRPYPALLLIAVLLAFSAGETTSAQDAPSVQIKGQPAHPTRILARIRPEAGASALAAPAAAGLAVRHRYTLVPGLILLDEPAGPPMAAAARPGADPEARALVLQARMDALRASGLYDYVEPSYLVTTQETPTDTAFVEGDLWGLHNTGQNGGAPGADIGAVEAWNLTTGSRDVIVAVIDTGIRYTHADLAAQMWRNPGESGAGRETNGADDDGNGYIDDVFGLNAITRGGDPRDDHGHGTHVAGTIGAAANDGNAHVGVAWEVQLMALKFLNADGSGFIDDAIRCVDYAVQHGARILNNSWGGGAYSQGLADAIARADTAGVLFVASAGNHGTNTDLYPAFPASYPHENILSVAALDRHDRRPWFSNVGPATVDLGAPGVSIYSTFADSDTSYRVLQGTSMAAPHVSGVAALVAARFPGIPIELLRDRLLSGAMPSPELAGRTVTGGRVNAFGALNVSPDGTLELYAIPPTGTLVAAGSMTPVHVRVTDLSRVTDAVVTGSVPGEPAFLFRDDGLEPDLAAGDAIYAALVPIPATGPTVALTVMAEAPAKAPASLVVEYDIIIVPANDDFADAIVLTGVSTAVTGHNIFATREEGEPVHHHVGGFRSVWWTWTAEVDGVCTLTTDGSSFDTVLAVYVGDQVNALSRIASNDDHGGYATSAVVFAADAGTTYQFAVDGYAGVAGSIALALEFDDSPAPPANDHFADAIALVDNPAYARAVNYGATLEPGEPVHGNQPGGRSVWWSWTAEAEGLVTITVRGNFDTSLAVYTGSAVDSLTTIVRDDDSGGSDFSQVTVPATAGATYYIAVDGEQGARGETILELTVSAPVPANDFFLNRLTLSGPQVQTTGTNVGATGEAWEPNHGAFLGGVSVWWTWTAPADGLLNITTTGSSFDTYLAVYTGATLSTLSLVGRNDNDPLGGTASRATFDAVAGTVYQIAVDGTYGGFPTGSGTITLNIDLGKPSAPPLNDHFADRLPLTGTTATASGVNFAATKEAGEPQHALNPGGRSVWWTWTAPQDGRVVVDTVGSTFETVLAIYQGGAVDALTLVNYNHRDPQNSGASRITFLTTAGATYEITVDGFNGATGTAVVNVTVAPALPGPVNDDFAQRIELTGTMITTTGTNVGATRETNEPFTPRTSSSRSSVWWTWTAPEGGTAIMTARGSEFDAFLAVYTGTALPNLTLVAEDDQWRQGGSYAIFEVVAGTTYAIVVDGGSPPRVVEGTIVLEITLGPPPPPPDNDNFANRKPLTGTFVHDTGVTYEATAEPGEPRRLEGGGRSIWWSWTAPISGPTVISTYAIGFYSTLAIFRGTELSNLTMVAEGTTPSDLSGGLSAAFDANHGTTYIILVDTLFDEAETGEVQLTVQAGNRQNRHTLAHWRWEAPENFLNDDAGHPDGPFPLENSGSDVTAKYYPLPATGPGSAFPRIVPLTGDPNTAAAWLAGSSVRDDRFVGPAAPAFGGARFTLEAFVHLAQTPEEGRTRNIASRWGATDEAKVFRLHVDSAGVLGLDVRFFTSPDPLTERITFGTLVLEPGRDYYIAVTSREFFSSLSYVAYVQDLSSDGPLQSESRYYQYAIPFAGPGVPLSIGGATDEAAGEMGWDGLIDEVRYSTVTREPAALLIHPTPPVIEIPPLPQTTTAGGVTVLHATVRAPAEATYQWQRYVDVATSSGASPAAFTWVDIPGATGATLTIPSTQAFHVGSYRVVVSSGGTTLTSPTANVTVDAAPPSNARLVNLSARAQAQTGDNILIPGFVVSGTGTKKLLIRAVGPTLAHAPYNIAAALDNPRMALKRLDFSVNPPVYVDIDANDDWLENPNAVDIADAIDALFAFPLADDREAVLLVDLAPGQYTVFADGVNEATGIAIVELYDADPSTGSGQAPATSLVNISNRGFVGSGDSVMIPGFVVSQEGPKTLLIRVVGPTLAGAPYNVPGTMVDPKLEIFPAGSNTPILANDNWGDNPDAAFTASTAQAVGAFALANGSADAAFVVTLPPGNYTVIGSAADGASTGVVLVEIYVLP